MRVAIVELMPVGHITLVESVASLFLADPSNQLMILCTPAIARDARALFGDQPAVQIWEQEAGAGIPATLGRLADFHPDLTLITTLGPYYREYAENRWEGDVWMVVHNLDLWFENGFWENCRRFGHRLLEISSIGMSGVIYWFKNYFLESGVRLKIVRYILRGRGHRFVVLNDALRREMQHFVPLEKVEVIPFSLYTDQVADTSGGQVLRICIPGYVTQVRRDYLGLLEALESRADVLKGRVLLDFLGALDMSDLRTPLIIKAVESCRQKGLDIRIYENRLSTEDFDKNLGACDLIMGNLQVQLNQFSRYGKTKESGIPFTMIKAAKPGLLPEGYDSFPELASSTVFYASYGELMDILERFVGDPQRLLGLKRAAKENSEAFRPERIYQTLRF